ncbi:SLBB domain-containing protein [Pedobacter immunditicola]|uniref:SLBB domain-containing protein n=1 Tax=Pedobacter immunditicola TaxID=3133440 RepID=UPI003097BCAB
MKFRSVSAALLLILLFSFSGIFSVAAQSGINYAEIKVDDLSDAQIRQLIQRAESIGYSDAQLEQMATAQGMKPEEIQKLRSRVDKIRNEPGSASNVRNQTRTAQQSRERTYLIDTGSAYNLPKKVLSSAEQRNAEIHSLFDHMQPKIFGAELFRNSNLSFEPNLRMATPANYIVGPDDELLIDLSGDNEASHRLKVSPEGAINMQYVGRITVGGMTIEQASAKIKSQMSTTFPGLRSGRSQVAVNLGNIRSIKITVLGEVIKPGSYTLPSLATVFNALYASGGPNQNGSFRKIQVIRNNKVVSTIDVYNFLLRGIQANNIRLQDQDVINVPVYQSRVEVAGEVKRPAFFEVLTNESMEDVLHFAGGFNNEAYTAKIKVLQNTDKERKITDVAAESFAVYQPLNGDKYIIEAILDRFENRVEITGAVFRPGAFELEKGLTLKGLINKADGIKEDAFLNRGYISRLDADNSLSLLSFDLEKVMNGSQNDILLQREDRVTISSIFDLREEYKVTIQGEVRQPGTFMFAENMSLEALIQIAGGFREGATPNRIEISRRIKNSDATSTSARTAEVFTLTVDQNLRLGDSTFVLQPFDIVTIRNSEGYQVQKQVKVIGEVLYPGIYTVTRRDERISDLITRAGGLSPLAYVQGASLRRNGNQEVKTQDSLERDKEEKAKLLNLNRLKEAGARDTTSIEKDLQILRSDLVGIDLEHILKKPISREDLILEDGDVIRIPRQLQTVRITGEVLQPNSIVYNRGKSFKNYINGAGGFNYNAYKKGAYIVYSNGSVEAARKFLFFNNYPEVKPGAEIFVPKRAQREKMSIQSWIGVGTAAASLGAIVVSLLR